LRDLITDGSGPAATWLGGRDVWDRLAAEYRRLAQDAVHRGDYRRAAYLYGMLLRDFGSAAGVLETGGLFRDAAILYRDKLKNFLSAAILFERVGDLDEAIRLNLKFEHFETVGDLCRRIGDDDVALDYYGRAADRHAAAGRFLAAGDLMRTKAGRADAAYLHYRAGWDHRGADSLACGTWVFAGLLVEEGWPTARTFLDEAEQVLAPPRTRDAGAFFNQILTASRDVLPTDLRDDLEDRTRLFFASHLRVDSTNNPSARELFGGTGGWPAPVVRDAVAATTRKAEPTAKSTLILPPPTSIVDGTVLHVAVARRTRAVAVASNVSVAVWMPDDGQVVPVTVTLTDAVLGLGIDSLATRVFVLLQSNDRVRLQAFRRTGPWGYERTGDVIVSDDPTRRLYFPASVSTITRGDDVVVDVAGDRQTFRGPGLLPVTTPGPKKPYHATHLIATSGNSSWDWSSGSMSVHLLTGPHRGEYYVGRPGWRPTVTEANYRPVDWIAPAEMLLEVTGVDADGDVYWSEFGVPFVSDPRVRTAAAPVSTKYVAACLVGPGKVAAAATDDQIYWLYPADGALKPWARPTPLQLPAPIFALVARPAANELVAVLSNGLASRIPFPA
jgi:hypothetical protein